MNNAQYRAYLLHNFTIDFCSAMGGNWDPIINLFEKDLKKYSNFYSPCPRRGHFYFTAHGLNMSNFPKILPDGFYNTKMIIYTKFKNTDHVVLQVMSNFEIIPLGIERF